MYHIYIYIYILQLLHSYVVCIPELCSIDYSCTRIYEHYNCWSIWAVFKTTIKIEWKLFILARNPCAILARPQWELARGQFFKLSLRELARRQIPEIWWTFACAMQARSWFRTWDSPLIGFFLGFSASGLLGLACGFAYCPAYSSKYGESTIMLLRVSVGHIMGRNPFACAKLARTLREPCAKFPEQRWKPEPIMLCNPSCCIFMYLSLNYILDYGLARSLRVHELARSLWKACARVTPFNFLKNKFHRRQKSIAGSVEGGSFVLWAIYGDP